MDIDGEWVNFENIKRVYNESPQQLSLTMLTDISRMVTIILTQKIFDERGYRRLKITSYQPTFNLEDVREGNYDFQDDKWLRVAMYNSDTRGFHFKRWKDRFSTLMKGRKRKRQF